MQVVISDYGMTTKSFCIISKERLNKERTKRGEQKMIKIERIKDLDFALEVVTDIPEVEEYILEELEGEKKENSCIIRGEENASEFFMYLYTNAVGFIF